LKAGRWKGGAAAVFFCEEDVVVLARIEGWVEIDKVDRPVGDVVVQDFQVVAVVELVLLFFYRRGCRRAWIPNLYAGGVVRAMRKALSGAYPASSARWGMRRGR